MARTEIHSPALWYTNLIGLMEGGDSRVYGLDVLAAGRLMREEFTQRAGPIQEGAQL